VRITSVNVFQSLLGDLQEEVFILDLILRSPDSFTYNLITMLHEIQKS